MDGWMDGREHDNEQNNLGETNTEREQALANKPEPNKKWPATTLASSNTDSLKDTTPQAGTYISLVYSCPCVNQYPHSIRMPLQAGDNQRGVAVGLLTSTQRQRQQSTHM